MKNENASFGLLTAIILAGVIAACVPPSNANDNAGSGLSGLTAYIVNAASASSDEIDNVNPSADQSAEVAAVGLNPGS